MKISVPLIDGYLPDKYTKHAHNQYKTQDKPTWSFPINIDDAPNGVRSYAVEFLDYDSIPVCGFMWIHWLAANFSGDLKQIPENVSKDSNFDGKYVRGNNSGAGSLVGLDDSFNKDYLGPQPPDKIHAYTLTVYALDTVLDLKEGYWFNEFKNEIKNHVIEKETIELLCKN